MTITSNKGAVRVYKATLFQKEDKSFIIFDTISRGRILKLLITDQGQNIFAYNVQNKQLFHKKEMDRFDPVLNSGFYYFDLNNAPFLDNYTPKISGKEKQGNNYWLRIENIPLDRGVYSKLNVYVDSKNDFRIKRIDYYDTSGVLMKSMNVIFDKIPIKLSRKKTISKMYPVKLEMMDLSKGTVSVLEFLLNDRTARLDDSLFKKENIEK